MVAQPLQHMPSVKLILTIVATVAVYNFAKKSGLPVVSRLP
jgi:hypothetical protein